ncbi:MAG TPA: hypothetical protein V6C65_36415 [Allocoleopsis sp.]
MSAFLLLHEDNKRAFLLGVDSKAAGKPVYRTSTDRPNQAKACNQKQDRSLIHRAAGA